jgi:hypothetical protein
MPVRGRRPRYNASAPEAAGAEAFSGTKQIRLSIGTTLIPKPYVQVSIVTNLVGRPSVEFSLVTKIVDRMETDFSLRTTLVDRTGTQITAPMFAVTTHLGGDTGYPTPPRIETSRSLVVGQPLRRHREVIQAGE